MAEFSIIMAYMDGNSSFRRRNVFTVIERCIKLFPDAEIVVAEQGKSSQSDKFESYEQVKRIQVDAGEKFHKTRLLNEAVRNTSSEVIVMVDADSYIDENASASILNGIKLLKEGKCGILYPFDAVDYLTEAQTRMLLGGETINSKFCAHGVHIQRQTGLCNMYLKSTWEAVRGFDEAFIEWGAEDDAFMYKIKRLVGIVKRTEGHVYHLFHPVVNTDKYINSSIYLKNRKICACVRRMTDDDLKSYVSGYVSMDSLVEKYDGIKRLSVRLQWPCTKHTVLTIDTTIYDVIDDGNLTFTKLLDVIMREDGPDYMPVFVKAVLDPIPDLSDEQKEEIKAFLDKAKRLSELEKE